MRRCWVRRGQRSTRPGPRGGHRRCRCGPRAWRGLRGCARRRCWPASPAACRGSGRTGSRSPRPGWVARPGAARPAPEWTRRRLRVEIGRPRLSSRHNRPMRLWFTPTGARRARVGAPARPFASSDVRRISARSLPPLRSRSPSRTLRTVCSGVPVSLHVIVLLPTVWAIGLSVSRSPPDR